MTDTVAQATVARVEPRSLLGRAIGVIFSPRATYAGIASRPRVFGALALTTLLVVGATATLVSTAVGRQAVIDQQARAAEARGRPLTDQQSQAIERVAPYFAFFTAAAQIIFIPLVVVVISAIGYAIFTAFLGGDATFKQVVAVTAHTGFVLVLAQCFVLPLDYVRESLTSPTTLAVFFPFLDEASFLARFLGALDLVYMWWALNLAIGWGVLYKRRTSSIASGLFIVYVIVALVVAAVRSALSGA
jgi:hypothetical protein